MSRSIDLYNQLANHKLFNKSVKFGLKRIKLALQLLENPESNAIDFIDDFKLNLYSGEIFVFLIFGFRLIFYFLV